MNKTEDVNFDKLYDTVSKYMNDEELDVVKKAYSFAKKLHFGVKRLTGEDYIFHPVNVAYILTENKADVSTICAALLHDILEDTDVTYEELETEFGTEIVKLVDGVTKINKLNFVGEAEADLANHRKILVGLCEDVRVIIIKLADRLHNMRTLWVHSVKKQKMKAKETLDILTPIAHRLGMNHIKSELEDLSLRYYKPDVYFTVVEKLNKTKVEREQYVEEMIHEVSTLLDENHIKHEIKGRSKSIFSIYKKMDKGKKFSDIYDLLALRVLVANEQDCYSALGIIHSKFKPLPKRFKDYIAMPKTNMYQSLHTTVFGVKENLFEIQIRTYAMNEVAENGIASHWSYKEHGSNVKASMQNEMEQKLQFFKGLIDLQKEEENDEDFMRSVEHDLLHNTIYIFTPKGDVIELPKDSTPIDFAYKIHTKVGDQMIGAIVNGNIVPLDYELQNNDIVKINTNKNSLGPSREWITIAKTSSARNKIKSFFNKLDKDEYIKNGQELILKELKKLKINYNDFFTSENIELMLEGTKLSNLQEIFTNVGNNKLLPSNVLHFALRKKQDTKEEKILKTAQNKEIEKTKIQRDIIIDGITDMKINIASCCKPIPEDEIIGYITKGYGVTVHRTICPNVTSLVERLIPVYWNDDNSKKYSTTLLIKTTSNDLLLDIISKASNNDIGVQSVINIGKGNTIEMTVLVENTTKLKKFMNDIDMMNDVVLVERDIK